MEEEGEGGGGGGGEGHRREAGAGLGPWPLGGDQCCILRVLYYIILLLYINVFCWTCGCHIIIFPRLLFFIFFY